MILTLYKRGDLSGALVYVNGKRVEFKPKQDAYAEPSKEVAQIETDGHVKIEAFYMSPLLFSGWAIKAFIFWLCGLFGLVSPRYAKKSYSLEYSAVFDIVSDATFVIQIQNPVNKTSADQRAVILLSPVPPIEETGECWRFEPLVKKRRKRITVLTWLFWILALAGTAVLILMYVINK